MTKEETPQSFSEYAKGYRDGVCDTIIQLIGLVSDNDMEYIFAEIELEMKRQLRNKEKREYRRKWGP
jgi:hypothetical protein